MKISFKVLILLFITAIFFMSCEFIEHGKDAFVGSYNLEINYDSSEVKIVIVNQLSPDLLINPPADSLFGTFTSDEKITFIDTYFLEGTTTISDIGGDSVKYVDNKRTMRGKVVGDSILFVQTDLGEAPSAEGLVIDTTVMNAKGASVSNDIYIDHNFIGLGSVELAPGYVLYGVVKGTIKTIASK